MENRPNSPRRFDLGTLTGAGLIELAIDARMGADDEVVPRRSPACAASRD